MRDKNGSSSFGSGGAKDPRLEAIMKEAMQRSAADFEQIDEEASDEHDEGFVMKFNDLSEKTKPLKKRSDDKI